jgi:N-acyl-L-homoserine lactone synthetase
MQFITGTSSTLPEAVVADMASYRYKVFVERLGWDLNCKQGVELDQFDRDDTLYVAAQNEEQQIVGVARLLSTTRPYLLSEVFPELMGNEQLPASEEVWELSRFAAMNFEGTRNKVIGQFSSSVASELMHATLKAAAHQGARNLITVSPMGIERILRNLGIDATRVGRVGGPQGKPIFASWITVN